MLHPAKADENEPHIVVSAPKHACRNAIVRMALSPRLENWMKTQGITAPALVMSGASGESEPLPAQVDTENGQRWLTFLIPDISPDATRIYRLQQAKRAAGDPSVVRVTPQGPDIEVALDGKLFTRYTTRSGPNKPFFYPIQMPEGQYLTRRWKTEPDAVAGESHDHPHHRGLWFAHSSVNGIDFWLETGKTGKTVSIGFDQIVSGNVWGGFLARTEWRTPEDRVIASDVRTVRIYSLPGGDHILDFDITLTPVGGPLVFGDNKDGVFGLRLPDTMAVKPDKSTSLPGSGHIQTSIGNQDEAAWGKPAAWVDYWGPIGGQTFGVAIFDHADNLRHPETWHARTYGLFTVNPFGLHAFGQGPENAGDYTVAPDSHLRLRYRVLFHKGDTQAAHIEAQYAGYAEPLTAGVRW